jgi:hypothetical protein
MQKLMKAGAPLTVVLGATVTATMDSHSATNGATFPDGSKCALVSNDPTVAAVPADVPIPAGGATSSVATPVTILASGSSDITVTITAPDGSTFTDVATVIVTPVVPGMTHVTITLTSP